MWVKSPEYLVKDLLQGDEAVAQRTDFLSLDMEQMKKALQLVMNDPKLSDDQKKMLLHERWRINYRMKPPSIEEFLSPSWIGETANHLYPYVKTILTEFWNPVMPYRNLLLAPHIGFGKSFISVLTNLYIATILWCMRNPKSFFPGLSPATVLTQLLFSFTLDKAKELLLDPFKQILTTSDRFFRARTEESLEKRQKEFGDSKICWTTAGTSALQLSRGVNIKIASDVSSLLGLSIISGTISEISFFVDRGYSYSEIWRVYSDLKKRVFSRFPGQYFARTIMDSSPNELENPIDRYVFTEADKDMSNFIVTGSMWDWQPWKFKKGCDTFPVFIGSAAKAPFVFKAMEDMAGYGQDEVIHVPELDANGQDVRTMFEDDLLKSLKDIAGIPAGGDDKLIQQKEKIEAMFVPSLRNTIGSIHASANDLPERLIWDQIVDIFFNKIGESYRFWRNADELRFISIDQSLADDSTAIVMTHPEINKRGEIVDVADFTLVIQPQKNRVNLEAIGHFIRDLARIGKIRIGKISFDRFQSEATVQNLKRYGYDVEFLSVDTQVGPYLNLVSEMYTGRLKVGRNVFLKNNLKSLKMVQTASGRKKVDHMTGKNVRSDDNNWETSNLGFYAKDVSDALAASIELRSLYFRGTPRYIYSEEALNDSSVLRKEEEAQYKSTLMKLGLKRLREEAAGGNPSG